MTIFELTFFVTVVCPVITNSVHLLLDSYTSKNPIQIDIDPSPTSIANVLTRREYILIDNFNLDNYLIIIILIILLLILLYFLYVKIDIIETNEHTEVSPNVTPIASSNASSNSSNSRISSEPLELDVIEGRTTSQNSNITRRVTRFIYLHHAIRCAIATICCLIFYQIFFYYYGLGFKYIGSTNELIVLFIETIRE